MSLRMFWNCVIAVMLIAIAVTVSGCSGSGFIALGGSGAIYNPNNEHGPEIVRNQPTQAVTVGRAKMLPMVGEKKKK
ncbi:hypothetical protein KAR91_32260 [Candidatus Pacearchaeota archaeon]|nr:hypothetical protein [Candidatus Pacearchaeota archaeon]